MDHTAGQYCSFRHIKNFPPDYLKIDGDFVRGLGTNPVDRLVVQAIVGLARAWAKNLASPAPFHQVLWLDPVKRR
jgi:EAL domain-containing protein (putative c-di-GMP-specific phosphodiesterase class I)